jgi:hypothetical protein
MGRRILRGEASSVFSRQSSAKASLAVSRWSLPKAQSWRNVLVGGFWSLLLGCTSLQFLIHSERAVAKVDLFTLREVVSQYTLDHHRSPHSFYELKIAGYLNSVPSFIDEPELFVPAPEIQDPPLQMPLRTCLIPENRHNAATRS